MTMFRRVRFGTAILTAVVSMLLPTQTIEHADAASPQILGVVPSGRSFETYALIELRIRLTALYTNAFDPSQIDVHAVFVSPRGVRYTCNGFYYQDYVLAGVTAPQQQIQPRGTPEWRIRFAAPQSGKWNYRVYLRDSTGQSTSSKMGSPIIVHQSGSNGFIRVSRHDRHYLAYESGRPFFPVGENMAWWDRGVQDYDNWITGPGKVHDQRANFIRIWMAPRSFGLDTAVPLGNYLTRMSNAWALDHVLSASAQNSVSVLLTLETHANFRNTDTAGLTWTDNPYNRTNGGPLQQPCDFFTNPTAISLFQRNLRYVVARWGYSTSILGWELWNEVDLVKDAQARYCQTGIVEWHKIMISTLRTLDPYHHLITTSFARGLGDSSIWQLPGIDIVQAHDYNYVLPLTVSSDLRALRAYGKPAWLGEFGLYPHVSQYTTDRQGAYIHDDQWASLMSGGAGSGYPWFWDYYVDQYNTYAAFHGLPKFVASLRLDRHRFIAQEPQEVSIGGGVIAHLFVLRGDTTHLIWLYIGAHEAGSLGNRNSVTIKVGTARIYRVHWWDTTAGREISSQSIRPQRGHLTLVLPGDRRDYAAKIVQVRNGA